MSVKTQGTHVYIIDPDATGGPEVMQIPCALNIDGFSMAREQIESTCLEDQARTYEPGLATPGQATIGLNFDPKTDQHARIVEMWKDGTKFELAIGFADGVTVPTVDTDGLFDFPSTRSFIVVHDAYFADVPLSLPQNALVTSNVSIQLSGFYEVSSKA